MRGFFPYLNLSCGLGLMLLTACTSNTSGNKNPASKTQDSAPTAVVSAAKAMGKSQLLDRYYAAMGGKKAWDKLSHWRLKYRQSDSSGVKGPQFELEAAAGKWYQLKRTVPEMVLEGYFDGLAYRLQAGKASELTDKSEQLRLSQLAQPSLSIDLEKSYGPLQYGGESVFKGQRAYRLQGPKSTVYLSAQDFRLLALVDESAAGVLTQHFTKYQKHGEVYLASEIQAKMPGLNYLQILESVELKVFDRNEKALAAPVAKLWRTRAR